MRIAAILLFFAVSQLTIAAVPVDISDRKLDPVPEYVVMRAESALTIDGKMDEPAWQKANPVELAFPWEEQTGEKQKTTARLLWDDQNLYVFFDCEDKDVTAKMTERDSQTYLDDCVEIFVNADPTQIERPRPPQTDEASTSPSLQAERIVFFYGLETNASGVYSDFLFCHPRLNLIRLNMDGVQVGTTIDGTLNDSTDTDKGYTVELSIPLANYKELAGPIPPKDGAVWLANISRWDGTGDIRRLSIWSDSGLKIPNPHNPDRYGRLVFRK